MGSIFRSGACLVGSSYRDRYCLISYNSPGPVLRRLRHFSLRLTTVFVARSRFSRVCKLGRIMSGVPFIGICLSLRKGRKLFSSQLGVSECRSASFVCRCSSGVRMMKGGDIVSLFNESRVRVGACRAPKRS